MQPIAKPALALPSHMRSPQPLLTRQFEVIHGENPKEFTRQLIAKFGKRYVDMVKQYGAVEYVINEDGDEIFDIVPPEEYLAESDEFATQRFKTGAHDSRHYSITAGGLARIAAAEAQFYAVQFEQLKSEPSFLREQIEEAARARPELLPDSNGVAPTPDELLAIPRFVGQLCRFTIHNLLGHLGIWNIISKYLLDIQNLDDVKGRFGAIRWRNELMGYVKFMIEGEINLVERRVQYGICNHSVARSLWVREMASGLLYPLFDHASLTLASLKNHPDYTGARMANDPNKGEEFAAYFCQKSVDGAFVRFIARDMVERHMKWTPHQSRVDLFHYLDEDTSKWQTLDPYLCEQLTLLRRLMDFEDMLQHPEAAKMPDDRYQIFGRSLLKSEATFKRITLEKYIKNIQSLERPSVATKIWREIDLAFKKEHGFGPERLIGYEQALPQWHMPLPASASQGVTAGTSSPTSQPRKGDVPRRPSPPPAKIKPYWDGAVVSPRIDNHPTPARVGPKVKTRPEGREAQPEDNPLEGNDKFVPEPASETQLRQPTSAELPIFRLGKTSFEVFERIFSLGEKGQLNFSEFKYAMIEIGFGFDDRGGNGSRAVFQPPRIHTDLPFHCHTLHGNWNTLDKIRISHLRKNLHHSYGWTMEWFALKSDGNSC